MPPPSASTRWRPTPFQLMMLKELYTGGIKTPNACQIQQITSQLSLYGKIECKNVFYWFQNHKAREKQKLRRRLISGKQQLDDQQQQLMGQNFNHNAVVYFPEPHYKCGSLQLYYIDFSIQGSAVQNGSRKVIDNAWVQRYDDKDVDVDDSTATTSNSGSGATGPPKTLLLFPTTATGCRQEEQPSS